MIVPETEEADVESPLPQFDADDSEDDNIPIAQTRLKSNEVPKYSDSEEEFTPLSTTMKPKLGLLGIGTEVMRQFDAGLFLGTVLSFNSKDGLYKIEYTDGEREDMDEAEFIYAYQLALGNGGDENDLSSDSADEESAYILPKVRARFYIIIHNICHIFTLLNRRLSVYENREVCLTCKRSPSLQMADAPNWRSILPLHQHNV